jgi:gliding motility-associated-like protein
MALKTNPHILIVLSVALLTSQNLRAQSYYAMEFTENKGQWSAPFQFRSQVGNGVFFIEKQGFTVLQNKTEDYERAMSLMHGHSSNPPTADRDKFGRPLASTAPVESFTLHSHAYRVHFMGSLSDAAPTGEKQAEAHANYFIGNDPTRWKTDVRSFQAVTYRNLYPNVDVHYYSGNDQLKYDLILHPGADLSRILMRYEGADKVSVRNGQLLIQTSVGEAKELAPYAYQVINGQKQEVGCQFSVSGDQVRFKMSNYDRTADLIIDPTLIFSTFTGSRASNWGYTATPGPDGSFFSGGIVFGQGYPITAGALQANFGGGSTLGIDIGITRFAPDGKSRIYSTYLGGSGDDYPHSMFADPQGNLVVLGRTNSANYPSTGGNFGSGGGFDIVVSKLGASGNVLIGSLTIGGKGTDGANIDPNYPPKCGSLVYNYGDNQRSEVILDASNNVYVAASTQSDDFPLRNPVQATIAGKQDAVLIKLSPNLNTVLFSTYFGGSDDDAGFVLSINPLTGNIYMAGGTLSADLPGSKTGVIQPAHAGVTGDIDGYIAEFSPNGTPLIRTTYLGTSNLDIIYGIQFDRSGFPYVMGISLGTWTVKPSSIAYQDAGSHQFITKLQPDLSAMVYSTVFGTASSVPNISPVAFLVDRCENVYVSGWGGPLNVCSPSPDCFDIKTAGPAGMRITADAIKKTTDNRDFYFFVMEKDGASQLYGSFFGQTGGEGDHVDGGTSRFDQRGAIYQAICANCGGSLSGTCSPVTQPFPTTPGVVAPINGALGAGGTAGDCNLAAIKILFDYDGVKAGAQASVGGIPNDTSGCVPLKVDFADTIGIGKSYEWDFGDGSPIQTTTVPNISYNYTTAGFFKVTLVAVDPAKCITRDTSYTHIRVRTDRANVDLLSSKLPPCQSLAYQFDNLSIAPPGKPFPPNSFVWDFGDGSARVTTGNGTQTHTYSAAGTYNVHLVLKDTSYCNSPDSIVRTIRLSPNVKAEFQTPPSGCTPYSAVFNNTSQGGQTFIWDFGDGTTYTGANPPAKSYSGTGTFTIKLIANDPATCNQTDTFTSSITIHDNPIAGFSWSPQPSQENTPTRFTNSSVAAIGYFWDFGDGDTSVLKDPVHQYKATGDFNTCLLAYNEFACFDTICQVVPAIVSALIDVPNAFSPNGDGINDRLLVKGYGIAKMNFSVYNRWGQLVYHSADQSQGWDGKLKGMLQPMDTYAYVVEVVFSDGSKATKKGDVTLLR